MVSIIAARSRTHFASSAGASPATAISASGNNFFIIEWPPARAPFNVEPLQQGGARTNLTAVGAGHSARTDQSWPGGRDYLEDRFIASDLLMTNVMRILRHRDIVSRRPAHLCGGANKLASLPRRVQSRDEVAPLYSITSSARASTVRADIEFARLLLDQWASAFIERTESLIGWDRRHKFVRIPRPFRFRRALHLE